MNKQRIRKLNNLEYASGPIVYWMNRDMRIHDNWALVYAQEEARLRGTYVIIIYNLVVDFLGGGRRQFQFKIEGLQDIASTAATYALPFFIASDLTGKDTPHILLDFLKHVKAGMLVTDFSPLRISRGWVEALRKKVSVPMYGVDAHNIIPCWVASTKQEFAAYTFRPKVYKLLPDFLEDFPRVVKQKTDMHISGTMPSVTDTNLLDWNTFLDTFLISTDVPPVTWATGGEIAAKRILVTFLQKKIIKYADKRNDPNEDAQSDLSPYLHYGYIAPQRVVLEVLKEKNLDITKVLDSKKNKAIVDTQKKVSVSDNVAAYLEELIVRRELSDNFCFYNEMYDSPDGFSEWSKATHLKHKHDPRAYTYTRSQFEKGKTHDPLWNAAQMEMVLRGKMHGYMRMYWAKKILEWTKTVDEAMKIAIYLNDKYELDGRDPNGYAGIAWSIGGVHDRAWFERPVFGQIRYMNANGCRNKFDVDAYIRTWLPN